MSIDERLEKLTTVVEDIGVRLAAVTEGIDRLFQASVRHHEIALSHERRIDYGAVLNDALREELNKLKARVEKLERRAA